MDWFLDYWEIVVLSVLVVWGFYSKGYDDGFAAGIDKANTILEAVKELRGQ